MQSIRVMWLGVSAITKKWVIDFYQLDNLYLFMGDTIQNIAMGDFIQSHRWSEATEYTDPSCRRRCRWTSRAGGDDSEKGWV